MKWKLDEEIDGKSEFISLVEYIPNTQVILELISPYTNNYDKYLQNELVIRS